MDTVTHDPGFVYLLHFERPIAPGAHTAQHYIGHADDLARRIQTHERGRRYNGLGQPTGCARIVEVAHERGIRFQVARVWRGGYELERRLKRRKDANDLCPVCNRRPDPIRYAAEIPAGELAGLLLPL